MNSSTTESFWRSYERLPPGVRRQARDAYALFAANPHHPGLHFKRVHANRPIHSVRINSDYRAVGVVEDDEITWFWIGSHTEYDHLLTRLRRV